MAPVQCDPAFKKMPIVSVCACRRPERGSLSSRELVGVWRHPPQPTPHHLPSTLWCVTPISAQGDPVTWESPPSCLGYHGNQRRSRQHLALVRRGGEGGRRSRKETGENGREGSKGRADSGQEKEYLSDLQQDLAWSSFCTVSPLIMLSYWLHHSWMNGCVLQPIVIFNAMVHQIPLDHTAMSSCVIPLFCR